MVNGRFPSLAGCLLKNRRVIPVLMPACPSIEGQPFPELLGIHEGNGRVIYLNDDDSTGMR